jgi:predicted MPP superfamily phosphohydrolase
VLANAVDADQSALFDVGFELVLAGLVFFGGQLLTERVLCGDEGRAQGVVLGHELFVSRGAGTSVLPLRLGARAEVVVFDL